MDLTLKDRLILANQYLIRAALETSDYERARFEDCAEIARQGYRHFYDRLIGEMTEDDGHEANFVMDVLTIYRGIANYKAAHPQDEAVVNHPRSTFEGFDANESSHYTAALFIFDRLNLFQELKRLDLNTHSQMLGTYEPMLATWRRQGEPRTLTAAQVLDLLAD